MTIGMLDLIKTAKEPPRRNPTAKIPMASRETILDLRSRMTEKQAAKHLGISLTTFQKWRKKRKIPADGVRKLTDRDAEIIRSIAYRFRAHDVGRGFDVCESTIFDVWNGTTHKKRNHMIKYKTNTAIPECFITEVPVTQEIDSYIWIGAIPTRKSGPHVSYHDSWEEAKSHLLEVSQKRLDRARCRLQETQEYHGHVVELHKQEDT